MIDLAFSIDDHDAYTLHPDWIGDNKSGWKISGIINSDWYEWVNEFEAIHEKFGKVWGDFEKIVYADSKEAYDDFIKNHPPESWDYWDI